MDDKRKKTLLFLGSLLVAVMFLTGAAGLGSGNSAPSSSAASTHMLNIKNMSGPISVILNATVYKYGSSIKLSLYNDTYANKTAALLSSMRNNGSIDTFTQVSDAFDIYPGKYNTYQVYVDLLKELGNSSFSFSAPEYIRLPAYANLSLSNGIMVVNTSLARDYEVYSSPVAPNSTVQVTVLAMVGKLNGTYVFVPNNTEITKVS
jgi:hypothetical protein